MPLIFLFITSVDPLVNATFSSLVVYPVKQSACSFMTEHPTCMLITAHKPCYRSMHVGCSGMNELAIVSLCAATGVTDEKVTLTSGSTDVVNRNISGMAGYTGNL